MSVHALEPYGFETMTRREKREFERDLEREEFRRATAALKASMPRAEIRELFESEMKL